MDRRQPIFRSQFSNLVSTRNDNGIVSDGQRIGVFIPCFFERISISSGFFTSHNSG